MDFLATFFTVVFVAVLIGTTLMFGMTLLMIMLATAVLAGLFAVGSELWRRWRFVKTVTQWEEKKRTPVIEGDYEDVSDEEK